MEKQRLPSEIISDFIELLKFSIDEYEENKKKCEKLDSLAKHIEWAHLFELEQNCKARSKIATAFHNERVARRESKNICDMYVEIHNFAKSENNKAVLKRLEATLARQKHQEDYLASDRCYKSRDIPVFPQDSSCETVSNS